jgi:hypothetical protein
MPTTMPQRLRGSAHADALVRLLGDALERAELSAAAVAGTLRVVRAWGGRPNYITGPDIAVRVAAMQTEIAEVLADDQSDLEAALRRVDKELRVLVGLLATEHGDQTGTVAR